MNLDFSTEGLDFIHGEVFESAVGALDYSGTTITDSNIYESLPEIVNESKGKSSGEVLGVLEGVFFMPNSKSFNKRYYSETLWKNVCKSERVKGLLKLGMLGTFEHPNPKIRSLFNESGQPTFFHPVNACSITKKLTIESHVGVKSGIGKAYVIDTPIGRVVDTLLRSKDESGKPLCILAVSSRAWAANKGKTGDGYEIMDENRYYLESFDITMYPGIAQATPVYKPESVDIVSDILDKIISTNSNNLQSPQYKIESFTESYTPKSQFLASLRED